MSFRSVASLKQEKFVSMAFIMQKYIQFY